MKNKGLSTVLSILSKFLLVVFLVALPTVSAVPLDGEITPEEKQQFDEILTPVMKIYNLIKYAASVIAVMALLFAGLSYMFASDNPAKRDKSKSMGAYVIIGLFVIWAAPFVVDLLIAT